MSEDKSPAKADPQLVRFEGMQYVRQNYTTSRLSDTEFAELMISDLKHQYTHAHVREWRRVFGIPNNKITGNEAKAMIHLRSTQLDQMISSWPADSDDWVSISPGDYTSLLDAVRQIRGLTK